MGCQEIIEEAIRLKPDERFRVIEGLLNSLDQPDAAVDAVWADEAERRLKAYREGRLPGIAADEVLGKDE